MRISFTRFGLVSAIAVVAAALADPIVEFGSNAGWFGAGSYTDHSNLDVLPALLVGVGLLGLYMARKARAVLCGQALRGSVTAALPAIFLLQMLALYVMETFEQFAAFGHLLGPTAWLGGPLPISVAIHAALCVAVTFTIARSKRAIAATTLKMMRLFAAITLLKRQVGGPSIAHRFQIVVSKEWPVLGTIGERAPPIAAR